MNMLLFKDTLHSISEEIRAVFIQAKIMPISYYVHTPVWSSLSLDELIRIGIYEIKFHDLYLYYNQVFISPHHLRLSFQQYSEELRIEDDRRILLSIISPQNITYLPTRPSIIVTEQTIYQYNYVYDSYKIEPLNQSKINIDVPLFNIKGRSQLSALL